jgi:RibD C-terminal domain
MHRAVRYPDVLRTGHLPNGRGVSRQHSPTLASHPQQALAAGLVDEVVLHVVPKLIGRGVRMFGTAQVDLHCIETIHGEGAVHLRYQVK